MQKKTFHILTENIMTSHTLNLELTDNRLLRTTYIGILQIVCQYNSLSNTLAMMNYYFYKDRNTIWLNTSKPKDTYQNNVSLFNSLKRQSIPLLGIFSKL